MAKAWFIYNSTGSIYNPSNYTIVGSEPICPGPKIELCAVRTDIQLIVGVQRPLITPSLQAEIAQALTTLVETDDVKLWTRPS